MKEQKIFFLGLVFNSTVRPDKIKPGAGHGSLETLGSPNAGKHWLRFLCFFGFGLAHYWVADFFLHIGRQHLSWQVVHSGKTKLRNFCVRTNVTGFFSQTRALDKSTIRTSLNEKMPLVRQSYP